MTASDLYEAVPEPERFLGAGRFGWVKKVRRKSDGKFLACKSIRYQDSGVSKTQVLRECALLKQLDHPNVVRLVDVGWQSHKAKIYMEYCEGGSLQDLINQQRENKTKVSEQYVWMILFQLASALLSCHHGLRVDQDGHLSSAIRNIHAWNPVIHRDIKPANVLLLNRSETALDSVKLGDFGLGHVLQYNAPLETYAGTREYLPPEINRLSTRATRWTTQCDIFSLGCTLYTVCNLSPPFDYHMELESDSFPPIDELFSSELRKCIVSCLSFQPGDRPIAVHLFQLSQRHIASTTHLQPPINLGSAPVGVEESTGNSVGTNMTATEPKKKIEVNNEGAKKESIQALSSQGRSKLDSGPELKGAINQVREASSLQNLPSNSVKITADPSTSPLQDQKAEAPETVTQDLISLPVSAINSDGSVNTDRIESMNHSGHVGSPEMPSSTGDDTFILAAQYNNVEGVKTLLELGASIDGVDGQGRTALSYAAEEGNLDVVIILLEAGADPYATDLLNGRAALEWATLNDHSSVVSFLFRQCYATRLEYHPSGTTTSNRRGHAYRKPPSASGQPSAGTLVSKVELETDITKQSPSMWRPSNHYMNRLSHEKNKKKYLHEGGYRDEGISSTETSENKAYHHETAREPSYKFWQEMISGPDWKQRLDAGELLHEPPSQLRSSYSDPGQIPDAAAEHLASATPATSRNPTDHMHSESVNNMGWGVYPSIHVPPNSSTLPKISKKAYASADSGDQALREQYHPRESNASRSKTNVHRAARTLSRRTSSPDPKFSPLLPSPYGGYLARPPSPILYGRPDQQFDWSRPHHTAYEETAISAESPIRPSSSSIQRGGPYHRHRPDGFEAMQYDERPASILRQASLPSICPSSSVSQQIDPYSRHYFDGIDAWQDGVRPASLSSQESLRQWVPRWPGHEPPPHWFWKMPSTLPPGGTNPGNTPESRRTSANKATKSRRSALASFLGAAASLGNFIKKG